MENQINGKKQETLTAEYESNMKKNDMRLEELRKERREIEECQDELREFRSSMMTMIRGQQYEYANNDSLEDLAFYQQFEEDFEQDYHKTNIAIQDKQDEIERERKKLYTAREDMKREYKKAVQQQ